MAGIGVEISIPLATMMIPLPWLEMVKPAIGVNYTSGSGRARPA